MLVHGVGAALHAAPRPPSAVALTAGAGQKGVHGRPRRHLVAGSVPACRLPCRPAGRKLRARFSVSCPKGGVNPLHLPAGMQRPSPPPSTPRLLCPRNALPPHPPTHPPPAPQGWCCTSCWRAACPLTRTTWWACSTRSRQHPTRCPPGCLTKPPACWPRCCSRRRKQGGPCTGSGRPRGSGAGVLSSWAGLHSGSKWGCTRHVCGAAAVVRVSRQRGASSAHALHLCLLTPSRATVEAIWQHPWMRGGVTRRSPLATARPVESPSATVVRVGLAQRLWG